MNGSDRRVIEHYLPLKAISAAGAREKKDAKGKIQAIHLWWARRPVTASRAAVYGVLAPAPEGKNGRGGRSRFVAELCTYPGSPAKFAAAEKQLLEAHSARLSTGAKKVTPADIVAGRAPRPRVLDPFTGGGSIPLEAARLGCESHALELNPIAHLLELVTLDYARRHGPWLSEELKRWGSVILKRAKAEIGDLYPAPPSSETKRHSQLRLDGSAEKGRMELAPVAYLWTRTVCCKRPDCGGEVPLVRQAWLCVKKGRVVAVRGEADVRAKAVRYRVVEAASKSELGFDPEDGSKGGNATCPFCHAVADGDHVKREGCAGRLGCRLLAVVCARQGERGKVFLGPEQAGSAGKVGDAEIARRIEALTEETGITAPGEPLPEQGTLGFRVQAYGLTRWRDLFTPRQLLSLLVFTKQIRQAHSEMLASGLDAERARAIAASLTCVLDRLADFNSSLCRFIYVDGERVSNTFARSALPMVWDFAETNPFNATAASWPSGVRRVAASIENVGEGVAARCVRGSATELPFDANFFDAIVTDPPYYDNVPYADLSDFFYVWAKRAIGHLYPEHFATPLTPKRREAIAEPARHGGNKAAARRAYEEMMAQAFAEMNRVLKPGAPLVCVYAHKTVAGWATLIDALRTARFVVVEAWPLATEKPGRLRDQESAALGSSIFLVARRREGQSVGSYEREVRPELEAIVRERTETLWKEGLTGADLVISAVGAGLRAFTRFERVEYENGDTVPADGFIREVEGAVLETVLQKIGVRDADPATKFYLAWRLQYAARELDAGEAIVFAYPLGVELDGAQGLTAGGRALVTKKGKKMCLRDFEERGDEEKLGLPDEESLTAAPLVDVLHRILWLVDHKPGLISEFLDHARADGERLRLVAQALAGTALEGASEGGEAKAAPSAEQSAVRKLIANWRSIFEESLFRMNAREARA